MTWSNYSFGVGLALGAGVVGIIFLLKLLEDGDRKLELEDPELQAWELREPGASDIGSRLPLDRMAR